MIEFGDSPPTLRCVGDEDCTTQSLRRGALVRALLTERDVIVDLSGLRFADGSLMADLAMLSRRLRQCGKALWLRNAPPQIMAVIEFTGLHRLPGVRIDDALGAAA